MATDDPEKVTARVAMNYSASADGYAEFWGPVIRPLGRRLLEALPWDRASRILDIGTGTGTLIADILSFAPTARLIGIDRSFGMLARATGGGVPLVTMDAMTLGVRGGTFDIAVLAFVLFHVPDPSATLAEVKRALRRRGTIGMTTWAEDPATPASQIWDEELSECGALDPSPQPPHHDMMNTPQKVEGLLRVAGFTPKSACPQRQTCSVGGSPIGVRARRPVAWMAGRRETKALKPIDEAVGKDGERVAGP
jgi:SAM-dependent methyltransferase